MASSGQLFKKYFHKNYISNLVDEYISASSSRGVDGVGYVGFLQMRDFETDLISKRSLGGVYRFSPYRQKLIIKDAVSPPRQISIPTIRDKIALRALNDFLLEIFQHARPQHSHPVISSVIRSLKESSNNDSFIKIDIKNFYASIDHEVLLKCIKRKIRSPEALLLVRAAICNPTGVPKSFSVASNLGVPQGLSVSNILASVYLNEIDEKYQKKTDVKYHRYVDDILCISPATISKFVFDEISSDLKLKRRLCVHPEGSGKSLIKKASQGIDYLGYSFSGKISVRSSTEKKLMSSLMKIIYSSNGVRIDTVIWRLNLRITGCRLNGSNIGWMFYFSQINDCALLARVDAQVKRAFVKKFGLENYQKCKRLLKSFYEIRYNFKESKYFIDFDKISGEKMKFLMIDIFRYREGVIDRMSEEELSAKFGQSILREVREMERDTLGSFS